MNPLFVAAGEVQEFCRQHHFSFCFIGGLSVLRWGEPRLTRDIDLTILTGLGGEQVVIAELLGRFRSRIVDAAAFALRHRVVLASASNDIPLDVALGALDFEERVQSRASAWDVGGASLLTCSAEDLIVHKAFAGRARDWADIEGVVTRQGTTLQVDLILSELAPLLDAKGNRAGLARVRDLLDHGLQS